MWIELDGAANVRDVGGLLVASGGEVAAGRLIRSDNLQGLTTRDVRQLVDDLGVRAVADLRTTTEVVSEGPGPLTREPAVQIEHLSLFPEDDTVTLADTDGSAGPPVLPWVGRPFDRTTAASVYLGFIYDRPDSIIAALRLIAHTDGATLVHCAAGKDRTGVVVALALDAIGVPRAVIIDEYALTEERLTAIMTRLAASSTYAHDIRSDYAVRSAPRPDTLRAFFDTLDADFGGPDGWLAANGWTDADQAALVAKLTG